jgi:hypothetical protein
MTDLDQNTTQPNPEPSIPVETPVTPDKKYDIHFRKSNKPIVYALLSLLVLVGGMGIALVAIQKPQDVRNRAANTGPSLALEPATKTVNNGDTISWGVTINTGSDTVSAVELKLTYDPTALQIVNFAPSAAFSTVLSKEAHNNGTLSVALGVPPTTPYKGSAIVGTLTGKIINNKSSNINIA